MASRSAVCGTVRFIEGCLPNAHTEQSSTSVTLPPGLSADQYYRDLPKGPPPGLVRVGEPTLAPTRLLTNEDVSLFSDFAHYLDTGVDENGFPVVIDLTCLICTERKLLVQASVAARSQQAHERLAILPCGHFMGENCLSRWLLSTGLYNYNSCTHCPLCRFELAYECGHFILPYKYNPFMRRGKQIPITLPEGGKIPDECEICYKGNMDWAIDKSQDLLFPRGIISDLRFDSSEFLLDY
ncbi:hypothetical protein GGR58DRAFT_506753 [Xylaria digitata]|nr:hypothetical protein GGR58DRAFT_506753 [Xylaria digitata]